MYRLNTIILFFLILLLGVVSVKGQYYLYDDVDVLVDGNTLKSPWAGGINAPHISEFDLDDNGIKDLVIFDKSTYEFLPFLYDGTGVNYTYAPEYVDFFPEVTDWAVLKDFDGDGIEDIYTYRQAGITVYKGGRNSDGPFFTPLYYRMKYVEAGTRSVLFTSRVDIPGIADINGDGDLDILTFGSLGGLIRYFENSSIENGWGTDSLVFDYASPCWGGWLESINCNGGLLDVSCFGVSGDSINEIADNNEEEKGIHSGSTLCVLDKDGNGLADVVLGDAGCNNLVLIRNNGSITNAAISSQDTLFPKADLSVDFPTFHAAWHHDLNKDGIKDLVVAPNEFGEAANAKQLWYYQNNSLDSVVLDFQLEDFLVADMVDLGANTRPVFFDYNADGLLDILVGVQFLLQGNTDIQYGLALLENIGTESAPQFELVDTDYAGLSSLEIESLSPSIGDIDGDGDLDMVLGNSGGNIIRLENTAGVGSVANFVVHTLNVFMVPPGVASAPELVDVDSDNDLDLLIGERNGNINYYKNEGSSIAPDWQLEMEVWGGIDVRKNGIPGYSVPMAYYNSEAELELLVGTQSGNIYRYTDIEADLEGIFTLADSTVQDWFMGEQATVTSADIDADGSPEFLLGGMRGGLKLYTSEGTPIGINSSETSSVNFSIVPNPASNYIQVSGDNLSAGTAWTIDLLDINGKGLSTFQTFDSNLKINISTFNSGIYLARIKSEKQVEVIRFVVY